MRRLLHIIPYSYFYPPKTGGQLRCFNLLHELSKYYMVDVISFMPHNSLESFGYQNNNITFHNKLNHHQQKTLFDFLPTKLGNALKYRFWRKKIDGPAESTFLEFYPIIKILLKTNNYDVVLLEHVSTLLLGEVIKKVSPSTLRILDQHNVDHQLIKQTIDLNNTSKIKNYKRILNLESNISLYADLLAVCSENDKIAFSTLNKGLPIYVVPNGTSIIEPTFTTDTHKLNKLIFCGSLDYEPNINGLIWFHNEIWPTIKGIIKNIELTIIGRNGNDSRYIPLKEDKQINFVGEVDDVTPYYKNNNISIVPLLEGSGTRLKILEAMAHGNPVISTSIGAEGLNVTDNINIIIADNPLEFSQKICAALKDPDILENIAKHGLELIQDEYEWKIIIKNHLLPILESVIFFKN